MTGSFLSSFSNILAYALIHIASNPEVDGWKWIYIVEGAITVGVAIMARFIIVDFPESKRNKFLSPEELKIVTRRLVQERGTAEGEKVTWKTFRGAVLDWPIWATYAPHTLIVSPEQALMLYEQLRHVHERRMLYLRLPHFPSHNPTQGSWVLIGGVISPHRTPSSLFCGLRHWNV